MMTTTDPRVKLLLNWLQQDLALPFVSCIPASSDASFRRYFRLQQQDTSYIVMDAPPNLEDIQPFIQVAKLLELAKVNVPHIYQQNSELGFLLLTDFGSNCLLDQLNSQTVNHLYGLAFDQLFNLQTLTDSNHSGLPFYDQALLARELELFFDWFLQRLLGLSINSKLRDFISHYLITMALSQPTVCVHRDYHSRNIMLRPNGELGIIDFQDAVIGPITYDLVSLLRDCYITWEEEQIDNWLRNYYQRLIQNNFIPVSWSTFKQWFDFMGIQRHLKAIGIFSRLHLRDQKSGYLADIPRTLTYVINVCEYYPELSEFKHYLMKNVLPLNITQLSD